MENEEKSLREILAPWHITGMLDKKLEREIATALKNTDLIEAVDCLVEITRTLFFFRKKMAEIFADNLAEKISQTDEKTCDVCLKKLGNAEWTPVNDAFRKRKKELKN